MAQECDLYNGFSH